MKTDHGYTWDDVRVWQASELPPGSVIITPTVSYHYAVDGGDVRQPEGLPLDGHAWTVEKQDGWTVTCWTPDIPQMAGVFAGRSSVLAIKIEQAKS